MDIIKDSALYFAIRDDKLKKKAKKYAVKMPQEAKDQMKAEKPDVYKSIFGEEIQTI